MRLPLRPLALLFAFVFLAGVAAPAVAACRAESALTLGQILDLNKSTIRRTGPKTVVLTFVLLPQHGFVCNGNGGTLPLPPGCTTDGITFKPDLSANVASVIPTADCRVISVNTTNTGRTTIGFRIRYEENRLATKRKTFTLTFDLASAFTQPTNLPLNVQVVPDPIE